jgi:hypothetical protein
MLKHDTAASSTITLPEVIGRGRSATFNAVWPLASTVWRADGWVGGARWGAIGAIVKRDVSSVFLRGEYAPGGDNAEEVAV